MSSISWLIITPSYMSPNAGGERGIAGSQPMIIAVHIWSPKKLWKSISVFNLWFRMSNNAMDNVL
jgi:hypothetical protein